MRPTPKPLCRLRGSLVTCRCHRLSDAAVLTGHLTLELSEVGARHRHDSLEPLFGLGRGERVSTAAADPEHPDPVGVDVRQRHEIVDDPAEVLDSSARCPSRATTSAAGGPNTGSHDAEALATLVSTAQRT